MGVQWLGQMKILLRILSVELRWQRNVIAEVDTIKQV